MKNEKLMYSLESLPFAASFKNGKNYSFHRNLLPPPWWSRKETKRKICNFYVSDSVEDSVLNMNCHKTSECMIIKTSTKCSVHLTVLFNLQSMRTSTSPAKRTVFMCMMGCQILCQLQIATRVMCWVCSAVWTPLTQWLWKPSLVRPKPG